MSNSLNLNKILTFPLQKEDWNSLEQIIKLLNDYMGKCAKNREYSEAQKAKQKIDEANREIKKRNEFNIEDKLRINIQELENKQAKEKHQFMREWSLKIELVEKQLNDKIQKKNHHNQEETQRLKEQVELALPIHHSPDDKLKHLRHEQKRLAGLGNYKEAQQVKDEIERRELFLEEKHKQLREGNIQEMLKELNEKQDRDMKARYKNKKDALEDMMKERNKKLKELEDRHHKDLKELKWMHQEEKRLLKSEMSPK